MSHPLIQSYGRTLDATFPLIVVIGREPNTDHEISDQHGRYDFDHHPRCGFWNVAYGVLGQAAGLTTRELKQRCRERQSSPLVFTDALPIGLKHAATNKEELRRAALAQVPAHIYRIFGFERIISRAALVIMSGLAGDVFEPSADLIEEQCTPRLNQPAIAMCRLPFFFGTNWPKIRAALDDGTRERLGEVMAAFLQAPAA